MRIYEFKSTVVAKEINLNEIAKHFAINKKFKWGEPLTLNNNNLKGIIPEPDNKFVYIFHFGSVIFINCAPHEMNDILNYLNIIDKNIDVNNSSKYSEDFKLTVKEEMDEELEFEINYTNAVIKEFNNYYLDMVATVLGKSVALEKIENGIDKLLDDIEKVIDFLDKGHLDLNDKQLAKMSGKILRYKHSSISYLLLLDKPDIAWKQEGAEHFFNQLSELFELSNRYEIVKSKSETLLDIIDQFANLAHSKRGNKLEWWVIILIGIELIMFGADIIINLKAKGVI